MREIVLDTETTGLDPTAGHRIVEIGCVELLNHLPTGKFFHKFLNPERGSDFGAYSVHKLTDDFLQAQSRFCDIADDLLGFIGEGRLVIHNADFDMRFLNHELDRAGRRTLEMTRVVDTIMIARQKYPGAQASLDALCRRFEIDLEVRSDRHGALIDANLLARVYLELIGGRQPALALGDANPRKDTLLMPVSDATIVVRPPRRHLSGAQLTPDEIARHEAFLDRLKDPLWRRN
jgi:DNA polymerase-3 subunit epsilon